MEFDDLKAEAGRVGRSRWRRWGPYLSERQWGTVREDYSPDGSYWDYFTFDDARSRAYRWGEDGIAGFSDDRQLFCVSVALWNHHDPFLKERLFGLSNSEGNHGEDVKECYYYLDALPSHAYLKMLYKYPQSEFPYAELRQRNQRGHGNAPEFELIDTGCFDENRYFDVFVEYAKVTPDDILLQITIHNRNVFPAQLDVLPQLWFRNTWSWRPAASKPVLYKERDGHIAARVRDLDDIHFYAENNPPLLFCDNETHHVRIHGFKSAQGHFKDAFHDYVIHGEHNAVNPNESGTKAAAHYTLTVDPGVPATIRCRFGNHRHSEPFAEFDEQLSLRRQEADTFYAELQSGMRIDDERNVQRQALAGMIWNKQFYYYDVFEWLSGDPTQPPPPESRKQGRNSQWQHLNNTDIISMPDKWEFPWYAGWDLAFHCVPFALIDPEFAKDQLVLFARERYMHPNGQLPAYEGSLSDVNPPVHAWAAWEVFRIDRNRRGGPGDTLFLERVFHKLLLNFTWWVNRKDAHGLNVFQGGFLGLDNIGVFDREEPFPTGGHIVQSDATSWMAMYSLNMMRIALELAKHNRAYEDIASKFFQHFLHIAKAMHDIGGSGIGLWDEEDKFYYDVLNPPNSPPIPMKARSVVGLIPLFAVETLSHATLESLPGFHREVVDFLRRRKDLGKLVSQHVTEVDGPIHLLALLTPARIIAVLRYVFDETEFLSPYGVRALSRKHGEEPYRLDYGSERLTVEYQPGESDSLQFGGNSNWRGPVWPPINYLLINALREYYRFYRDTLKVEFPTGSGRYINLNEAADELSRRFCAIFLRNAEGRRPVFGECEKFQTDPHFRDHILFHEYFHGETGRGCGASHQTGWTGCVANLLAARGARDGKNGKPINAATDEN